MSKFNEIIEKQCHLQKTVFSKYQDQELLESQKINKSHWVSLIKDGKIFLKNKYISVIGTHIFELSNAVHCISYETKECFFVYVTLYNIYYGIIFKNGEISKEHQSSNYLGYLINDNEIIQYLAKVKLPKQILPRLFQKKLLLFNRYSNLGHHIWNEQTGLDSFFQLDLFSYVDAVFFLSYDYLNSASFFKNKKIITNTNKERSINFSTRSILVHPTELVVFSKTLKRLRKHISEQKSLIKIGGNIIVLQLRQNNRRWLEEVRDLPKLIEAIFKLDPSTIFIIDGFSKSFETNFLEEKNIERDMISYQKIYEKIPKEIKIYTTIGLSILEKLKILEKATLVFSPIGSGGILANWLLQKTLITYGSVSYYEWTRRDSECIVEDYNNKIFYIDKADINMLPNSSDYNMSWEVLYKKFLEIAPII